MPGRLSKDVHDFIPELGEVQDDLLKVTEVIVEGVDACLEAIVTALGWAQRLVSEVFRRVST